MISNQAGQNLAEAICLLAVNVLGESEGLSASGVITTPFSTMNQSDWVEAVRLWNRHGRALIATLPARACPACGIVNAGRQIFESYDGYAFHECTNCRCWFVPLQVDAELFERFFATYPQALEIACRSFDKRQSEQNRKADLARFDAYFETVQPLLEMGRSVRYLDIGCGIGSSLISASRFGMDAYGIESSTECIRLALKANLRVFNSPEALPHKQFDLISFWESIEHISNPHGMLANCDDMLSENGLIVFSAPNLNSPLVRAQRADCSIVHGGYDTPGHINLFAPQHLKLLFDRAGFELLYLDGQYSANLPELVSYMLGKHCGAASLLESKDAANDLSQACLTVLENIATPTALLERASLTAPILFGVACRKSCKSHFEVGSALLRTNRQEQIIRQASDALPIPTAAGTESDDKAVNIPEGSFLSIVAARRNNEIQRLKEALDERGRAVDATLQEVTRRDQLLAATQAEVNKRDELLAARTKDIEDALGEVTRRDQLLAAMQVKVDKLTELLAAREKVCGGALQDDIRQLIKKIVRRVR